MSVSPSRNFVQGCGGLRMPARITLGEERIYRVAAAFESAYLAEHGTLVPDQAPQLEVAAR